MVAECVYVQTVGPVSIQVAGSINPQTRDSVQCIGSRLCLVSIACVPALQWFEELGRVFAAAQ